MANQEELARQRAEITRYNNEIRSIWGSLSGPLRLNLEKTIRHTFEFSSDRYLQLTLRAGKTQRPFISINDSAAVKDQKVRLIELLRNRDVRSGIPVKAKSFANNGDYAKNGRTLKEYLQSPFTSQNATRITLNGGEASFTFEYANDSTTQLLAHDEGFESEQDFLDWLNESEGGLLP